VQTLDYAVPVVDPAWSHVSLCYHIMALLLTVFPGAEFINLPFVARLLSMTQMPDARERTAIVTFVKLYWDTRVRERLPLVRALACQFALVRQLPLPPWTSASLLLIARHAVTLAADEMVVAFWQMTVHSILPLICSQHLLLFHSELKAYLAELHRVWPQLRVLSLWNIQMGMPLMGDSVSQYVTDLVVSIAMGLERRLFSFMATPFFAWLGEILRLPNRFLALTVLNLIIREENDAFVRHYASPIVHHCYSAICDIAQDHWHEEVRARASAAMNFLAHVNPREVGQILKNKRPPDSGTKKAPEIDPKLRKGWFVVLSGINWAEMPVTEEHVREQIAALLGLEDGGRIHGKFMPLPSDRAAKELYNEATVRAHGRKIRKANSDFVSFAKSNGPD
jgi:hypothetical protein